MNFKNVKTYIQSGNVIFDTASKSEEAVRKKIENKLTALLDYEIHTMIRTPRELEEIVKNNPFSDAKLSKELVLYLSFLSEKPGKEKVTLFESLSTAGESLKIINREIYCLLDKKKPKPLFSTNMVEKKLNVKATSRNWNTIIKMHEFMNE